MCSFDISATVAAAKLKIPCCCQNLSAGISAKERFMIGGKEVTHENIVIKLLYMKKITPWFVYE
jgi:hypothetical protein